MSILSRTARTVVVRLVAAVLVGMLAPAPAVALATATPGERPPDGSWPLDPRPAVVEAFDPPADPWGRGHRGVDLAGRAGQPVRSALPGTVGFAGRIAGRSVLVVDHGATRTTYEPVAALVPVGTAVARGEVVGRLELAGSHCLPAACLHWGWRRGERYLDPLELVGAAPVRLLPLAGAPASAGAPPAGAAVAFVAGTALPTRIPPRVPIRVPIRVPARVRRVAASVLAGLASW